MFRLETNIRGDYVAREVTMPVGSANAWDAGQIFKHVFSGGNGVIYAITDDGDLLWNRHDGRDDGSFTWAAPQGKKVGSGWVVRQAFSGGDGVVYAVMPNGDLLWNRHDGRDDGSFRWAAAQGKRVGIGWTFNGVFSR